jgi:hypothetical protein
MSGANITNLVVGIIVLALFLSLQLATRRLRETYRLPLILAIIGLVQFAAFLNGHPHDDGAIVTAVAGHVTGKNGGNVGDATVLLYLVVTLAVQRYLLITRATRREAAGQLTDDGPRSSAPVRP